MQRIILPLLTAIAALLFVSCGPDSKHCSLDGRFLKMNQGEFRLYSPDGSIKGIDTIVVRGGRFEYETACESEGIIVIVLPNHYELPVFVAPGKAIELRADATSIKDIEIKGTDANKLMSKWRKENHSLSPANQMKNAEQFINDNPRSIVSRWLLYKVFVTQKTPDYRKIKSLSQLIANATKEDVSSGKISAGQAAWLSRMEQGMATATKAMVGDRLPSFSATDIYGKPVSSSDLTSGYALITIWTSYNYESQNINRQMKYFIDDRPYSSASSDDEKKIKPKMLSISLDASAYETKNFIHRDSVPWHVVCDEMMWDSPLIKKLGITTIPDNILLKDGKVIGRHMSYDDIAKKLKKE